MTDQPPSTPPWSEEKVRALTLHSGDIISLLDAQGRLLYNSPASERISGFTAAELAGQDTFQLIHPDDQAAVAAAFQRVLATPGAVATVEYRYRTKAGGWTWMEAVASNQLDNPEVRGVVANSRDVSERKRAEAAHADLQAQLVHRQRLEALGTLAGGVAHDFNNLLSALASNLALAEQACHEPAVRRELEAALAAVERGSALTRRILGFARRQPSHPVTLDLAEAAARWRPLLERTLGGRIAVALAGPAPSAWILADPSQLEQVLVNLATNARDAMPAGGRLELAISLEPPRPGEPPGGVAELRVTDSGEGMAPETLTRAFEPFFTTKPVGQGTGLGLAVTHGIVTAAGGSIRLESRPGQGTTAVVRWPLAAPPGAAAAPAPPQPQARARPGERILLADDDDLVRAASHRVLDRLGWLVDDVADGLEAVERAAAAPGAYAAAVLDLRMPRLGGLAAAERLAARSPGLPVLLVSGYAEDAEGREDVLAKPFDMKALGARLRRLIDGAAGPPAAS